MPRVRINDAQAEALLKALRSLKYRQQLAQKIASREGIKFKSAMRRLQRYVTTGRERRSFAESAARQPRKMQALRAAWREVRPKRKPRPEPEVRPLPTRRPPEIEPAPPKFRGRRERDISLYDLNAITAYHDGDTAEAAEALQMGRAGEHLLELAKSGVDIFGYRGGGLIIDQARDFYDRLSRADLADVQDFSDHLHDLPDWQIEVILDDIESGDSTFADWIDTIREAREGYADFEDSPEWWALWRQAYARAKA